MDRSLGSFHRKSILLWLALLCAGSMAFRPPGTVRLRGTTYLVDRAELSNLEWTTYLFYVSQHTPDLLPGMRPDSAIWSAAYPGQSLWSLTSPCSQFPVVGISFEQAQAYCEWRGYRVREKYPRYDVQYRLPTPAEWEEIRAAEGRRCKTGKGSYPGPTHGGLQHLCDNVSEMTSVSGIAKGGNRDLLSLGLDPDDTTLNYTEREPWLGFRCIAEFKTN